MKRKSYIQIGIVAIFALYAIYSLTKIKTPVESMQDKMTVEVGTIIDLGAIAKQQKIESGVVEVNGKVAESNQYTINKPEKVKDKNLAVVISSKKENRVHRFEIAIVENRDVALTVRHNDQVLKDQERVNATAGSLVASADYIKDYDKVAATVTSNLDTVDWDTDGEYPVTFETSAEGKSQTINITVVVGDSEERDTTEDVAVKPEPETNEEKPKEASNEKPQSELASVTNAGSELVLVTKQRALPADYVPPLKDIPEAYAVSTGYEATPATVDAFIAMVDTMKSETGMWMYTTSSYRDYDFQNELYTNYVAQHGQAEADRMSARPGTSEHQTGLVIDVVTPGGYMFDFAQTEQSTWVNNNAHKFGFIVRYPEGKEHITGYMPEAWHLRYVGKDMATKVKNSGLTFDEVLAQS